MTYLDWLCGEVERFSNKRRSRRRSNSESSQRTARTKELISIANNLYVKNDLNKCIEVLKDVIRLAPRNPHPYFTLGLIFEEREDLYKAYCCFLVAAHLQKNNYGLWRKLYDYSRRLGYKRERIYFIEILQRKNNDRTMVLEKMSLYGENVFRELSCKIELFEFDGVDEDVFAMIHEKITHKAKMARLARKLANYLVKNEEACSDYYLEQLVILKYEAMDFVCLKSIFDKFFLQRMRLTAKLRMIYIMASICDAKTDEAVDHSYSDIYGFLRDDEAWSNMKEVEPARRLVDILVERRMFDEAIGLLNRMKNAFGEQNEFICWKLGNVFREKESYDEALFYYNMVLKMNPINDVVKAQIHSIYVAQGNVEMARKYQTITQLVGIIDELGSRSRSENSYSPEMCMDMRVLYDGTKVLMGSSSPEEFIRSNRILVDDFLKNKFVFEKKRRLRQAPGEKQDVPGPMLPFVPEGQGQITGVDVAEHRFRFTDLHGLSVDEWFSVITSQVFSLLLVRDVDEATSLVFKTLEAHIFRYRSDLETKLIFVGLKIALLFGEFSDFVVLIRNLMLKTGNYSYSYLLFYFCNFFLRFHKNNGFCSFQKYIQRVCRRRRIGLEESCFTDSEEGKENKHEVVRDGDTNTAVMKGESASGVPRRGTVGVSQFLFLNSLLPNLLQSKTVEAVSSMDTEKSASESVILASMLLAHSKSRRVSDRNMFVKKGVNILKALRNRSTDESRYIASYNIGKAYHFFGFPGFAESFYLDALGTSDVELKRLAQFNLYLIYKKNNTMMLFKNIIDEE